MDSNAARHPNYFSVPGKPKPVSNAGNQAFVFNGCPTDESNRWAPSVPPASISASDSPSAASESLPMSLFVGSTNSMQRSMPANQSQSPSMLAPPRRFLPARGPRRAEGRERKRSKMNIESTPFDSVDYWMNFDDEESLPNVPESAGGEQEGYGPPAASSTRTLTPRTVDPTRRSTSSAATHPVPVTLKHEDYTNDDSGFDDVDGDGFSSLNLAEHLSSLDSAPPPEVPPREGLYSTPLSWEKPQMVLPMDSLMGLKTPMLSEEEHRRLLAIATNQGPIRGGQGVDLNDGCESGMATATGVGQRGSTSQGTNSPTQPSTHATLGHSKRKGSTPLNTNEKGGGKGKVGDRSAHNDIERKYRTNLKDRIAELREAVPALHTRPEAGIQDCQAAKVSKGTVLTKAAEYIHQLERRNREIVQEHNELSRRLQTFEQLLSATAPPAFQVPSHSRTPFDHHGFS